MDDVRKALVATRQVMNQVRAQVIAEAQEIADRAGSESILVTRLAAKYGVAGLTCKRWLQKAGFKLNTDLKGRPSYEAVLVHDGLLEQLHKVKARREESDEE